MEFSTLDTSHFQQLSSKFGSFLVHEYGPDSGLFDTMGEGIELLPSSYNDTKKVDKVVIWLHGLGDTAYGWFESIPMINYEIQKFNQLKGEEGF